MKRPHLIFCLISLMLYQAGLSQGFVENKGQIQNTDILYYFTNKGKSVYFQKNKISFVEKFEQENNIFSSRIDLKFTKDMKIPVASKISGVQHHYILSHGQFTVSDFDLLYYKGEEYDIYFYSNENNGLKYDIVYHANIEGKAKISFYVDGGEAVLKENDILIKNEIDSLEIKIPVAYSDVLINKKWNRECKNISASVNGNTIEYTFDKKKEKIIIDPWVTYCGGNDVDEAHGTAFDEYGNIYISGFTSGIDFPVTTGVMQTALSGNHDAFVSKFDSAGQLIWSTYYGGTNNDFGYRIVVDSQNRPILSGYSYSSDLPVGGSGIFSDTFSGIFDAFLLFLEEDGTFSHATFYGGTGGDFVTDMDILNDEIVISGFTSSMDLPLFPGAWQNTHAGALDIYLVKFDSTGNRIWDTYYGGTNSEDAHAVAIDDDGNVIVCGDTYSADFPVSAGCYQNTYTAGSDMCFIKFDENGQRIWSTFLGSTANEDVSAIDTDEFGNIYFAGYANGNGLPITAGIFQDTHSGDRDIIFGSISSGGNLLRMTFAGGTLWDFPRDLFINQGGIINITGESSSTDFPETGNTFQTGNNGNMDVFYIICDSLLNVSLATLWGGAGSESGRAVSFDGLYRTAIAGYTSSNDLNSDTTVFQWQHAGQNDAFLKVVDSTSGVFLNLPFMTEENNAFTLYPNPINDQIILTDIDNGIYELIITSIEGKTVYSEKIKIEGQISINETVTFAPGKYIVTLHSEKKVYMQKIIKL